MQNYFKRQIELWGEETQKKLSEKKIAIIGAGGLGSSLCFALGSCGISEIHIVDFDIVSVHNIHRQIAFKLEDVSKSKSIVNAKIIEEKSPFTKALAFECDFKTWSQKNFDVDIIIDATDNLQTRKEIDEYAKKKNIPWIYASVEAFNAQVCFFDKAKFEDFFKIKEFTPKGVAAPMVMNAASLEANLALRYLCDMKIKKDLIYYIYFNDEGEFITKKFSLTFN